MAKQRQRRRIGPMQIIEDEQQRLLFASRLQQTRRGGVEEIPLCLGITLAWRGETVHAIAEGGNGARQIAAVTLHMGVEAPPRCLLDEVSERLRPRLVGHAEILITAPVE